MSTTVKKVQVRQTRCGFAQRHGQEPVCNCNDNWNTIAVCYVLEKKKKERETTTTSKDAGWLATNF